MDWCEQPLRRKYPLAANQLGPAGGPQREGILEGGVPTVELFDSEGCLTAAALSVRLLCSRVPFIFLCRF